MNKKIKIAALISAISITMFFGASNVYASTGKVINESTRLRKKASTASEVVETITKNVQDCLRNFTTLIILYIRDNVN